MYTTRSDALPREFLPRGEESFVKLNGERQGGETLAGKCQLERVGYLFNYLREMSTERMYGTYVEDPAEVVEYLPLLGRETILGEVFCVGTTAEEVDSLHIMHQYRYMLCGATNLLYEGRVRGQALRT